MRRRFRVAWWAEVLHAGVGPPAAQLGVGVGAFMAGQIGEELVDAEAVGQVGAGGDAVQPGGGVASAGCGLGA
jgi:hypothetical protein